mgnify:CR=1 FL=1
MLNSSPSRQLAFAVLLSAFSSLVLAQTGNGAPRVFESGFEPGSGQALDCQGETPASNGNSYPCSIDDSDADQIQRALDLLDNAWAARHAGTMADALAYLQGQPDVIEAHGNDRAIRFRIADVMPLWLTDFTAQGLTGPLNASATGKLVVGTDTDDSGEVNNRDAKRALVMAPYIELFQPFDASESLAGELENLRGYEGNVTYRENRSGDGVNLSIEDYFDWDTRDFIYVAAPGVRLIGAGPEQSWIVLLSGVRTTGFQAPGADTVGAVFMGVYDGEPTRQFGQFGLTADFFRATYPKGLSDAMVVLPIAELDGRFAEAVGRTNFSMIGWDNGVGAEDGFTAMAGLFKSLRQGLTARDSVASLADGIRTVDTGNGGTATLEQIAPGGDFLRIIEVATLVDSQGDVLEDGISLEPFVIGQINDGAPDALSLQLSVDGVTPE